MPTFVDDELSIYIHEPKHWEQIRKMSTVFSEKWIDLTGSTIVYKKRDLCIARCANESFYRVEIKMVYKKNQQCLVNVKELVRVAIE